MMQIRGRFGLDCLMENVFQVEYSLVIERMRVVELVDDSRPLMIYVVGLYEIDQVSWQLPHKETCRLCQLADGKPEAYTKPFLDFLTENPTVFHAVDYFKTKLNQLDFKEVRKTDTAVRRLNFY